MVEVDQLLLAHFKLRHKVVVPVLVDAPLPVAETGQDGLDLRIKRQQLVLPKGVELSETLQLE